MNTVDISDFPVYSMYDQDTGAFTRVKLYITPFRTAWVTPPTKDDVLGADYSTIPMQLIKFAVTGSSEEVQRARIIRHSKRLGFDITEQVESLPDGYITSYLNNVLYGVPMVNQTDIPLRIDNQYYIGPYVLAATYLIRYLLTVIADELDTVGLNTITDRANRLRRVVDQLQFTTDRILVLYDLDDLPTTVIQAVKAITDKNDAGEIIATQKNVYIGEDQYNAWVAKGGSEKLLAASHAIYGGNVDDSTIENKDAILSLFDASQQPPT